MVSGAGGVRWSSIPRQFHRTSICAGSFEFFLELSHLHDEVGQPAQRGLLAEGLAVGQGGDAGDDRLGVDVLGRRRARGDRAASPIVTWSRTAACPPSTTPAPEHDRPGEARLADDDAVRADDCTLWAICTRLSILLPRPMRVALNLARSMQTHEPISTSSSMMTVPICGIFGVLRAVPAVAEAVGADARCRRG